MDPVSLIVAALAAGAATGVGESATDAVKDVYGALKSKLLSLFADKPRAQAVLEDHERDPETYAAPMAKQLKQSGAGEDREILVLAEDLLARADPEGTAAGKYAIGSIKADRGGVAAVNIHGDVSAGYRPRSDSARSGDH